MNQTETEQLEIQQDEDTLVTEEGWVLRFRAREEEIVPLALPVEALAKVDRIAARRSMSRKALLRLYIGKGLREDLARTYTTELLANTKQVLSQHLKSEEEVAAILQEIQTASAAKA
ncbi:MAG: hypothetical protein HYR56_28355 [Acidobacteria bacterium]|nr:hypothetical protein [Acidobacteriota bacterium]MBI3421434.1 hypothetical protein [Acidobacteriota bacterium]